MPNRTNGVSSVQCRLPGEVIVHCDWPAPVPNSVSLTADIDQSYTAQMVLTKLVLCQAPLSRDWTAAVPRWAWPQMNSRCHLAIGWRSERIIKLQCSSSAPFPFPRLSWPIRRLDDFLPTPTS
ncbi:hypothetical protein AAFF_G00015020 [Aldrovandia affinis]|uniref:Uncharacterized protein n=1 Tax=Aldrovandia affinis TaxID=143900 RepID=A0AAD7S657_9TELE|nr:hypothetical protein AAFF_G00015020 [Aldrovandia affinis]